MFLLMFAGKIRSLPYSGAPKNLPYMIEIPYYSSSLLQIFSYPKDRLLTSH